MRHSSLLALVMVCAGACLAKEYSITESFGEDQGDDDAQGGAPSGGRGGNGGTVSPPAGGEGGDDTGSGGSTGGSTGGSAGEETGGSPQGGSGGDAATGGSGAGGKGQVGGRGGAGGGTGGNAGTGSGGRSGGAGGGMGKGGIGGAAGSGTSGSGGMPTCGACIVHRYNFNGTDTTATDSVGTAHGTIVGGAQAGGAVTLAGGVTDQYVSLPAGVLSGLANITLEFWVTWTGGTANWQRVFDFGSNDGASGDQGSTNASSSYFFFTTRAQATTASPTCMSAAGYPRVTFTLAGPASEVCVSGASAFPPSSITQVAVTIQGMTLAYYMNGALSGTPATLPGPLPSITRTNNWLGRSQFSADTEFAGSIHEFRVYSVARSPAELAASNAAGPDTPPTQ